MDKKIQNNRTMYQSRPYPNKVKTFKRSSYWTRKNDVYKDVNDFITTGFKKNYEKI